MNWPRLLEILAMAARRVETGRKRDRGYQWACYCVVCSALRRLS